MGSISLMSTIDRFVSQYKEELLPYFEHLLGAKFTEHMEMDDDEYFYSGSFTLDNGETYPVHFAWVPEVGIDREEQEDYRQGMLSLVGSSITSIDIAGYELYEDVYLHICVDGDPHTALCVPLGFHPFDGSFSSYVESILGETNLSINQKGMNI